MLAVLGYIKHEMLYEWQDVSRPKPQRVQSMRETSQVPVNFSFLTIQSTKFLSSANNKNYHNNPIEYTFRVSQSSKH